MGQVERSGAGRTYKDLESFITGLREVGERARRPGPKGAGVREAVHVAEVVAAYREELERILEEKRR